MRFSETREIAPYRGFVQTMNREMIGICPGSGAATLRDS
jgi:hypothetical protein